MANTNLPHDTTSVIRNSFVRLQATDKAQTAGIQETTTRQDTTWNAPADCIQIFYKKTEMALKKFPQLREKLGMLER